MNVLITGARGFIGRNLTVTLKNIRDGKDQSVPLFGLDLMEYDLETDPGLLDDYCCRADFVFHLAGVNRPKDPKEFMDGNFGFTSHLLDALKHHHNSCPVMLASSCQAVLDNPYGISKRAGEDLLLQYAEETGAKVLIYRFPNVFGKWCRPNYNSVIATFCHNIARGIPIQVHDPNTLLDLVYIDDLIQELLRAMQGSASIDQAGFGFVPCHYPTKLGDIAQHLQSFHEMRENKGIPDLSDALTKKLYATYLSFLPMDGFAVPLDMHRDERGGFTEIFRTPDRGQISVNVAHPGVIKGNHWHHTKHEKFLVVSGTGVIRFWLPESDEKTEYHVSGNYLEVVDIPAGYVHNIENLGDTELVTLMWCSECFDPNRQDTYSSEG